MPLTQDTRVVAVSTPLGGDVLVFRSMTVQEHLGRLSHIELEVVSERGDIAASELLGLPVCITLKHVSKAPLTAGRSAKGIDRYLHGFVTHFSPLARPRRYFHYQITLVPWLWFLTRRSDCCIFQRKTTPAILEEVFKKAGFSDYELRLSGHYEPREYCVQYRETDFNFISRLMEEEGIYYYFEHHADREMLILADAPASHHPFEGYEVIAYRQQGNRHLGDEERVYDWASQQRHHTGVFTHTDYDFTRPRSPLTASQALPGDSARADYEFFDFPGNYTQVQKGQHWARARMEEMFSEGWRAHGRSDARGLATGSTFQLTDAPLPAEAGRYLVVSTSMHMQSGIYETGDSSEDIFECAFTAAKADVQYRSPRLTPKPVVQGVQTAVVTGPKGEEIYTDKYGRIKVQFFWDREGKFDANTTCFIRLSQAWAGKRWGATFIPRIGQEVLVAFLEGDPDQPIVIGSVYNGDQMPPHDLPAHMTRTTIKTDSTKGGGGFNELSFEDKKGQEQFIVQAQKDMVSLIKHDETRTVGNNQTLTIEAGSQTVTVQTGTQTIAVKGAIDIKSDASITLHVGASKMVIAPASITLVSPRIDLNP